MEKTNTRARLKYHARPAEMNDSARVMALAALHIGDELRELTKAINSRAPLRPTQAEIAERLDLVRQMVGLMTEQPLPPTEANLDKQCLILARGGHCWDCKHWAREVLADGPLAHCVLPTSPANTVGIAGKCTGFLKRPTP